MTDSFTTAGGVKDRNSKYAPLLINRFFSGQWSNSNPLCEAPTQFLIQKYYSGNRYDVIRSGQNVEVSPRLTIIRRPGNSVYNNSVFNPIRTFCSFRTVNSKTGAVIIRVLCDTDAAVYDCTGPSTKTLLFTKLAGSGQTSFQAVGNTLYAADGVSNWELSFFPPWSALTTYNTGDVILDSNQNLQKVTGVSLFPGEGKTIIQTAATLTIKFSDQWSITQLAELPGSTVSFSGFVGAAYLNGQSVTIDSVFNLGFPHPLSCSLVATLTASVYSGTETTGTISSTVGSGTSGSSTPAWATTIGNTTTDGVLVWTCKGPAVHDWGIDGPIAAPSVSNTILPTGTAWVASTYYWPSGNPIILDSNGNIQLLTTDGTTGTVPVWATLIGNTTTDGSAAWTCLGTGTRATTNAYPAGYRLAVTVTTRVQYVISETVNRSTGQDVTVYGYKNVTNLYFFVCTQAGTSSSTSTANILWPSTLGGTVQDGTVTWANAGYQITRVNSASTSPTSNAAGNVANTTLVTQVGSIVDNAGSGAGTGFTQNVSLAGKSGAAPPTWATTGGVEAAGLHTTETGGLTWVNGGPSAASNSGTWVYAFSFENSVTGAESSASPISVPITLAASSGISVSGNGDPNWQTDNVDTINIYRSVQGFSTPFFLVAIPAPAQGAPWSFIDTSPDPPNPTSSLNEFIEADTVGNNAPPPTGLTNLSYYLNRMFGTVGTLQYWSGVSGQPVGVGVESWPGLNFWQMPENITKSWPSATGLLMFTVRGVYYSQGVDGNLNPNKPIRLLEDIGLLSVNLFTVNGSIPVILSSDQQLLSLDPSSGVNRYSDPIADSQNGIGSFSTQSSYLTWHVNGIDSAYYLGDGTTGWFRLCPTAAPESGFTWSPKANIVGGCGCIQSIETSPGVKKMLVQSSAGGPILARDLTINTDNGTAYIANFTIGALVFAQPTQCAEVESISTFTAAVGTTVQVYVLCDEIAATVAAPFEQLPTSVPEPPFLNAPVSLYSERFYFTDAAQPSWLQHMQIKYQWIAENQPSEMFAFCVFGCCHLE